MLITLEEGKAEGADVKEEEGEQTEEAGPSKESSPNKWSRPAPLKVGSMKAAAGPATLARLERWAHDEEAAGFHVPLQTPQIASVRAKEEKGFVNAPPPTPAAQAMRVAQERSWVQRPPSTPAVKTIRSEQDGVHVPVHESSAKQIAALRSMQEDFFAGVNDLATLAVQAQYQQQKKLRSAATVGLPGGPGPSLQPRSSAPAAGAWGSAATQQPTQTPTGPGPAAAPQQSTSAAAAAAALPGAGDSIPGSTSAAGASASTATTTTTGAHILSSATLRGAAVWGASADALHQELTGRPLPVQAIPSTTWAVHGPHGSDASTTSSSVGPDTGIGAGAVSEHSTAAGTATGVRALTHSHSMADGAAAVSAARRMFSPAQSLLDSTAAASAVAGAAQAAGGGAIPAGGAGAGAGVPAGHGGSAGGAGSTRGGVASVRSITPHGSVLDPAAAATALGPQAVSTLLNQAALVAALRRAEEEGWVHRGLTSPAIQAIREDQEEAFAAPANTPAVQAVRKQLGGFRSVPVSPAGAEVRKTMDELKRPPMSPQLEAFRRALDDPFRDYKPPPIPVLGGGSAGASRAMSRSASLAH